MWQRTVFVVFVVAPTLASTLASTPEVSDTGCEKALDRWCPQWKDESRAVCMACVAANLAHLLPNCTKDKADRKCGGIGPNPPPSPPSPGPAPLPPPPPIPPSPPRPAGIKPNIFLMLTDDQDILLGSMNAMSFTRQFGQTGLNFTNFFAHTPVCCPSRSELLTGRYFHNLKTSAFDVPTPQCMHVNASLYTKTGNPETFAVSLQKAGYRTGMFGKYLNSGGMGKICPKPVGDGSLYVPVGWTDFLGACPDTCYVDCTYNLNAQAVSFTNPKYPNGSNYGTTIIGNFSLDFIRRSMAANAPFFAYVASHAPHGPATPSPTYADLYSGADVIAPRTTSYGIHSPDKHWVVAVQPPITQQYSLTELDDFYKNRMRALRSVDDILHDAHAAVAAAGQLDNTWWFFTSDHGLHLGQFCLGPCKRQPYDTDIRIPFLVVGPGVPAGFREELAGIVDLASTFLDIANATDSFGTHPMDGRSMLPLMTAGTPQTLDGWRDAYLIEYTATTGEVGQPSGLDDHLKDNANNTFIGLRIKNSTMDLSYFEFTDAVKDWDFNGPNLFCELYNFTVDAAQLHNLCPSADKGFLAALHAQLRGQLACSGSDCV